MNTYNVKETKDFSFFGKNVYLDKNFLLLIPECPLTVEIKTMLEDWDFNFIYSEGEPSDFMPIKSTGKPLTSEKDVLAISREKDAAAERLKKQQEVMQKVEKEFLRFLKFIEKIFEIYSMKKTIDGRTVSDKVKELCDFVKENKKIILRIDMQKYYSKENYLILHSLRSAIFALIIGIQLKMPAHKLIELGTSCMLHEIGMLRLPPQYYMYDRPLSGESKKALLTHPVLSYNILKASSFSLPVCLGSLEHHERENGKGYPRGLTKDKISVYGKIIAVACSYEAATGYRPYKEATDASTGLVDMLKNSGSQYDETILKALLFSLSFYPVGIYVHLSDGKIGQVIDINPYDPRFPIVQIYGETTPTGMPKIVGTDPKGITIKRPLTKDEKSRLNLNANANANTIT
ncbi:HD-GYP domain-containing protein [Treponema pedis]|uniref:HD-GYP domain-containing protein n=1 Tax=Treponema pedis TaxID=409322 RepID=A0A7S7AWM5_9SPIR|nr:HD-GYP domain-containing protein [Treponema pedis]QOW61445.1 HD-GYP domain-containing protein [Treponema pedis]